MATRDVPSPAYLRAPRRIVRPAVRERDAFLALLPAVLLFYASIAPAEMRVVVAGQSLYPIRIVGFAMMPIIFYRLVRDPIRWSVWDIVYGIGVFWMVVAFMFNYGPGEGIRRGFALAFDTFAPYLIARCCIRNIEDVRKFLIYVAPGVMLAAGSLLLEVLAGRFLVRPTFVSIFGALPNYEGGEVVGLKDQRVEYRLGILRAAGPFPHPILAGMFLATLLPLYVTFRIKGWQKIVGIAGSLCAILSMSTTALLGLIVGVGVLATDYLQRMVRFLSWQLIIPATLFLLFLLHMGTENGLIRYLSQFTLNPRTALYRRRIWEYATQSVEQHPWFGIGFQAYERLNWMVVSSIDAHWLLLAVRYGVITSFTMFGTAVAAVTLVGLAAGKHRGAIRQAHIGLAAAVLCVVIPGFAVSFFGGAQAWFYMLIAMGISVGVAPRAVMRRQPPLGVQPVPVQRGPRRAVPVQPRMRR